MTTEPTQAGLPRAGLDRRSQRYRDLGLWTDETLFDAVWSRPGLDLSATALVDGYGTFTYGQLAERIERLAGGLRDLGIAAGDTALLQLPNRAEFVHAFFALTLLGARPVMALPAHRETELVAVAAASQATVYIGPGFTELFDYGAMARRLVQLLPNLRILIGLNGDKQGAGDQAYEGGAVVADERSAAVRGSAVAGGATTADGHGRPTVIERGFESCIGERLEAPQRSSLQVALFQLSGGSTGLPKLIGRTHADYVYSARKSAALCQCGPDDRYLAVLPAAHNFTLSSPGIVGTLMTGGTVVLSEHGDTAQVMTLIERHRVSVVAAVPPLVSLWLPGLRRGRSRLASLRLIQVGGARLDPEVAGRLEETLPGLLQQVYGMAEGLLNYTRLGDSAQVRTHTQGRPLSEYDELVIVDTDGRAVAAGEVGELCTRGPYTLRAYHQAPEANRRAFTTDGYYRTGDLVRQLPDGNLVVVGRAREQVNRGGEKVAPFEVEGYIRRHRAVREVAVVGVPDRFLGERLIAFIVPEARHPRCTAAELSGFVRSIGVADFKVPDRLIWTEALPTTAVGKVDKPALIARALDPSQMLGSAG